MESLSLTTDIELERLQTDTEYLLERFQAVRSMLRRPLYHLGVPAHDHDDILQDVFIKMSEHIHQLNDADCFYRWLHIIAHRSAVSYFRKKKRMNHHAKTISLSSYKADLVSSDVHSSPIESILKNEQIENVRTVVKNMGSMYEGVLMDFYFDDLSLLEIADKRDLPLGTVKRRLHVARKKLFLLLLQ